MGAVKPAATKEADLRELLDADDKTRALLHDAALVNRLAGIVASYSPGGEWSGIRAVDVPWAKVAPQGRALARALSEVERLMRAEPLATILTWTDGGDVGGGIRPRVWSPKMRAVGGRRPWLEALVELRALALGCAQLKTGRRPGRPPDGWRDRFCREIAEVLMHAGQKAAKSRDGVFARVLTAALTVAEGAAPEDVFPLVSRAVNTARVW